MPDQPQQSMLAVRIPADLHRRLKVYAAQAGISLAQLIEQAVRDLLRRSKE